MKYIFSVIMFSALSLGAIFVGCGANDSRRPNPKPDPFPNTVGSWWVYERIDSLTMVTDTLTVIVTDTLFTCERGVANLWRFLSPRQFMDGGLVRKANDTIVTCISGNGEQFILPFISNVGWRSQLNNSGDTSTVDSIVTASLTAGVFEGVAFISRNVRLGFEGGGGRNFTAIAPNVGIIKRTAINWGADGGGTIDTAVWDSWTLLDYTIVDTTAK